MLNYGMKTQKARKEYECEACERTIFSGKEYTRLTEFGRNKVWNDKKRKFVSPIERQVILCRDCVDAWFWIPSWTYNRMDEFIEQIRAKIREDEAEQRGCDEYHRRKDEGLI